MAKNVHLVSDSKPAMNKWAQYANYFSKCIVNNHQESFYQPTESI